jgi:hypothetical protein
MACATQGVQPVMSSAEQPSYAKKYPGHLQSAVADVDTQLKALLALTSQFEKYPGELQEPDWAIVDQIVRLADREGKSAHFAERLQQNAIVASFYEEQKKEIHQRVGGSVTHQAKEEGCSAELYGPTAYALDQSFSKGLASSTRAASDAHLLIAQNETALGKRNIEKLQQQADQIALASYISHVGLVRKHQEIERMLGDASGVESTIDERMEALSQSQPPGQKLAAAEKKARDDELEALREANATLAQDVEAAKKTHEGAEDRASRAKELYAQAMTKLEAALEAKQKK